MSDPAVIATQSPIAINIDACLKLPSPIYLCLVNYCDSAFINVKVTNTGHTVMFTFPGLDKLPIVKCGPLKDQFRFEQVHFHWSEDDYGGSEHSINGKKFASEAHFVHYNTKYKSFQNAKDKKDGLVVIGLMLEICDNDNPKLNILISALRKLQTESSEYYAFSARCFFSWMEDTDVTDYVAYNGSLTTPPFSENVYWIVMIQPIFISRSQMSVLRDTKIRDGNQDLRIYPFIN